MLILHFHPNCLDLKYWMNNEVKHMKDLTKTTLKHIVEKYVLHFLVAYKKKRR